jgi:hypothetical protein
MVVNFTRLYADEAGESHFADLVGMTTDVEFAASTPPLQLFSLAIAEEVSYFSAPSGWQSDWHPSANRNLFAVMTGEWEVTASDRETRRFAAGSILFVEDTFGKGHTSRVVSTEDSVSLLVRLPL